MTIANTRETLDTEEKAQELCNLIMSEMGDGYISTPHPFSKENPEIGFYVDFWTKREFPLYGSHKDAIICTMDNFQQWERFKQAARVLVSKEQEKEEERKIEEQAVTFESFFPVSGGSPYEADHTEEEPVIFHLCFKGLETGIWEQCTHNEFINKIPDEFEPNVSWQEIHVASQEDKEAYIQAQNRYLMACWTPNQSREEREENAKIMKKATEEMDNLVVNRYPA